MDNPVAPNNPATNLPNGLPPTMPPNALGFPQNPPAPQAVPQAVPQAAAQMSTAAQTTAAQTTASQMSPTTAAPAEYLPKDTKPKKAAPTHSLPARLLGYFMVVASIGILAYTGYDVNAKMKERAKKAAVPQLTQVSPLEEAWRLNLPQPLLDPRQVYTWDLPNSNGAAQTLVVASGTDGQKAVSVATLVSDDGQAQWEKDLSQTPLDYCLKDLWQGKVTCESHAAKKVVTIAPDGNFEARDLPQWDSATGEHVLTGVLDQFLIATLGVGGSGQAGAEAWFYKPDLTYFGKVSNMVPGANAAVPLNSQVHGTQTLVGVHASNAQNEHTYRWVFGANINQVVKEIDTSNLGPEPQVSLLEVGFFASSNPEIKVEGDVTNASNQAQWKVLKSDGSVEAEGSAPAAAVQALHSQLRAGNFVDGASAAAALQSSQALAILNDGQLIGTTDLATCLDWASCSAKNWTTAAGINLPLPIAGHPLAAFNNQVVFTTNNGLVSSGLADGQELWSGILPPVEEAVGTRSPLAVGSRIWVPAQLGKAGDSASRAAIIAYDLPN